MPLAISQLVRMRLKAMLSDATYGFNAQLSTIAPAYGVVAFTIDWTGGTNWLFGRIDPNALEGIQEIPEITDTTSALSYAFLTIDTVTEFDRRYVMNATFAGDVQAIIELTLSFERSHTLPDFASWADACLASIREALSNPAVQSAGMPLSNPRWGASKGPIALAGGNFRQVVQATPSFAVISA